jgi:hypothetical protein
LIDSFQSIHGLAQDLRLESGHRDDCDNPGRD